MKVRLYLCIMLVSGLLCNGIAYADKMNWQLKDLISQADIIAVANVDQLHEIENDLLKVSLSVEKVFKSSNQNTLSFILTLPSQGKRLWIDPEPITFTAKGRYLVFLKYGNLENGLQSLQLVSPTSGAVRLEGDKTFRKPALLDGYFPQYRKFNEHQLLQRIYELIVEGPCWPPAPDRAKQLQAKGYPSDSLEQVLKAAKSEDYIVRYVALGLYAQRAGQDKAISKLKEALSDPKVEVRWHAAHWLGRLGSKSGLEQMQQDFKKLTIDSTDLMHSGSNTVKEPSAMEQCEGKNNCNLDNALDVARVLAELGDRRGYRLAVRMALESNLSEQRYRAVTALVEIAKTDNTILKVEDIKPVSMLCTVAKVERNVDVFYKLVNLVTETWKLKNLNGDIAIQILETAKDSSNQSKGTLSIARGYYDLIKAKMQI